jgi:adenosylcobinamide kinase / adenosylcobinamide-phosphate guanylyltransferase
MWEQEKPQKKLVVIGTDITKGIVPVDRENRLWRDVTGWAYQDLAAQADKIDIIWYGCNQTIKQTGEWNR